MIRASELVGHLEVDELDLDDGEVIIDALIIVRTVHPDRRSPVTCYTSTELDDPTRIGMCTIVADRMRDHVRRNWTDDGEGEG